MLSCILMDFLWVCLFIFCTQRREPSLRCERGWLAGPGHTVFQPEGEEEEEEQEQGREEKERKTWGRVSRSPALDSCVASWSNFCFLFIALGFLQLYLDFIVSIKVLLLSHNCFIFQLPPPHPNFFFSFFFFLNAFYLFKFLGCEQDLNRFVLFPPVHAQCKAAISLFFENLKIRIPSHTIHTLSVSLHTHITQPSHLSLVQPSLACSAPLDRVSALSKCVCAFVI